jgi:hypothetical protein
MLWRAKNMKKKKLKKMILNKSTITNLNEETLNRVKGGTLTLSTTYTVTFCSAIICIFTHDDPTYPRSECECN